jgi:DNA-binding Xre family transcriptional regulator
MGQAPAQPPGPESLAIAKQIRHAMIDAGIKTNTELADKAGVSAQTIGRIFSGQIAVKLSVLEAVCAACDVRVSDLVAASEQYL